MSTQVIGAPGQRVLDAVDHAFVDPAVHELRPDYAVLLIGADGLANGPSDEASQALLARAEEHARALLAGRRPEELPHIAQWRQAYLAFGAKPQRTRNSLEALTRRAADGLPRINLLTDHYNAISVLHQVPIGGEDLDGYQGPARLVRADGSEPFDTVAAGQPITEHPLPGEVVWRDDAGVTCRLWNWRQCSRTQLTPRTTTALFILDGLAEAGPEGLRATGDALLAELMGANPTAGFALRLIPPRQS